MSVFLFYYFIVFVCYLGVDANFRIKRRKYWTAFLSKYNTNNAVGFGVFACKNYSESIRPCHSRKFSRQLGGNHLHCICKRNTLAAQRTMIQLLNTSSKKIMRIELIFLYWRLPGANKALINIG